MEVENAKPESEIEPSGKRNWLKIVTEDKFVVYLMIAYINGRIIYIIGKTTDLNKRYRSYKLKGILVQDKDIKLSYFKNCRNEPIMSAVETCVLVKMKEYLVEGNR